MPLVSEDKLRLNVLCAQTIKAIRIHESSLTLYAITDKGEAKITLAGNGNSHGNTDTYLREVREFLSEYFLDMPGGYPMHLKRWTRMGFATNTLAKMLLLGEPEAHCSSSLCAECLR